MGRPRKLNPIHPGRGGHHPKPEQRQLVERMVAARFTEKDIAARIGISHVTLRARYAVELTDGRNRINALVRMKLLEVGLDGNVAALKAWLAANDFGIDPVIQKPAPRPPKLGKKEEAQIQAETAHADTDWANLVRH